MRRLGWDSSLDVAVCAGVVAVINLAGRSPLAARFDEFSTGYNLVFASLPALLWLWVLVRVWWLARRDDGPVRLMSWGVGMTLAYFVYTNLWGLVLYRIPFVSFFDYLAAVVRVLGIVLFAHALVRWSRMPSWFKWVAYPYAAAVAIAAVGARWAPVLSAFSGWALVVFTGAVSVALLMDPLRSPRVLSESQ